MTSSSQSQMWPSSGATQKAEGGPEQKNVWGWRKPYFFLGAENLNVGPFP